MNLIHFLPLKPLIIIKEFKKIRNGKSSLYMKIKCSITVF